MKTFNLTTPFNNEIIKQLTAGDKVFISGHIFTARDAAHKRWCEAIEKKVQLPYSLTGETIYFAGPAPAKPNQPIGSVGPTTSYRMDDYSPAVIEHLGIKGMIGKGPRSLEVVNAMKQFGCVYFAAIGGLGAMLANCVTKSEIIDFEDLGPEAVRKLTVHNFPAIVAIDTNGNNLFETGPVAYKNS
jgi:fumarate hydratase subunit beta